jgi:hypothetical protein
LLVLKYDQQVALTKTSDLLSQEFSEPVLQRVQLFLQSHESFPSVIPEKSISAIMYNLGYLPGGNKNLITLPQSTLLSIKSGQSLLRPGGIMTILCYRGHAGGKDETNAILETSSKLAHVDWKVDIHELLDSDVSPMLVTLRRRI